jgi:hypothetical protein
MSFIRPQAAATLARWREPGLALGAVGMGLWIVQLGGVFFAGLGAGIAAISAAIALLALRRMRFQHPANAPGIVQVIEGQLSYLGPTAGGFMALDDLKNLSLIWAPPQVSERAEPDLPQIGPEQFGKKTRMWRLCAQDGTVLLVPVAARGADKLFDAFASLPGLSSQRLAAAMAQREPGPALLLWRRPHPQPRTRPERINTP